LLTAAGLALGACSSSPPPTMDTVKKLVAEDRNFDALATLIPMAQGGDPAAQYELAGFYHYGYVGANDFAKALKWYRASARQGYADAMVGLSVMYLGGQGVAKDRRESFVWLNLAAQYMQDKHAVAKIKRVRDEIGKTLSPDDIAFAKAETILLLPEGTSVQPNEAESIDHLPDTLPATLPPQGAPATAPVVGEPLQNIPPETGAPAVPDVQLQNAPPAAPVTTPPASSTPATNAQPSSSMPSSTMPATTMPATTPVQTPVIPTLPVETPVGTPAEPAPAQSGTTPPPVDPVPQF
jgi:hypothetical protein